jgi:integrase
VGALVQEFDRVPDRHDVVGRPATAGVDPVTVYLARLTSAESRRAMATSLELLAEVLLEGRPADRAERVRRRQAGSPLAIAVPWHELRYGHTQALRSWLAEHCSPAAANRHLAALRGVLREAWRLGLMNGEDLARAVDLASAPGTSLPVGRYVEDGEVRRLVAACLIDDSPGGRRDAAVLAALFAGGLRRAEVVALDVDDATTGRLTVTGKGRRQRRSALPAGGRRAMAAWLELRGTGEGSLFCPVDKAGRVTIRRLTTQAIYALVDRRARAAGVGHLSPHDGRRTFASNLFDAGVDAVQVQGLMGHASLLTAGPSSPAWPPSSGCTSPTPPNKSRQGNGQLLPSFSSEAPTGDRDRAVVAPLPRPTAERLEVRVNHPAMAPEGPVVDVALLGGDPAGGGTARWSLDQHLPELLTDPIEDRSADLDQGV